MVARNPYREYDTRHLIEEFDWYAGESTVSEHEEHKRSRELGLIHSVLTRRGVKIKLDVAA